MNEKIRKLFIILLCVLMGATNFLTITSMSVSLVGNAITRYTTNRGWEATNDDGTVIYYAANTESEEEANANSKALALDIQGEGSVLLTNDGALPLTEDERNITVFGVASVNMAYGGTGSGTGNQSNNVNFYQALAEEGFNVNPEMHDFYQQKYRQGYRRGNGTDMNGAYYGTEGSRNYGYSINEVERSEYADVRDSYAAYSDAAVVVFTRSGGEGQDLPTDMSDFYENDDKHYLELTDEELDLLNEVAAGGFGKIIVLLNTLNVIETDFLFTADYKIDSCIWIGGGGNYGLIAVAEMLKGEREPSGRLSDTYGADLLSTPAMSNYGNNRYTENGEITTAAYVAYAESIYIGYRYYETRYADVVCSTGNAGNFDYSSQVVFPFGYGLSYTSFIWGTPSYTVQEEQITVSLTVVNNGSRAGKDVVQIYVQKPYTANDVAIGVEKSAVDLVGYAKTPLLNVGESCVVSVTFDISAFSSYDAYQAKTYRMDAANYLITAATDAHQAVNNFLTAAGKTLEDGMTSNGNVDFVMTYVQNDNILFNTSATGYTITNHFETDSYSSVPDDLEFLSRSNWLGTWPTVYGEGLAGSATKVMTEEIKNEIIDTGATSHLGQNSDTVDYVYSFSTQTLNTVTIGEQITSSGEGLNFIDMILQDGTVTDYDDPKWMKLVQCMSVDELYLLCSSGAGQSPQIDSINKMRSVTSDSPMGLYYGTLFPCYPIQSATFNTEIATQLGNAIAEEALWNNVSGWYAPACNTHRHYFGGRNYEYYSEDGTLAGLYAAAVVKAAQSRGLFVQIKHFALNDQDTNRGDRGNLANADAYNGLCTYANEQTIREIYLKTFQFAVEKGGAHGVMTSYNRIGNTWAGGHYGLLTEVLRNEWGLKGNALTDYAGTFGYKYMNMNQGLRAGNDVWLYVQDAFPIDDRTSNAAVYYLQKAAKNILYTEACSNNINGHRLISGESITLKPIFYNWEKIFIAVDVVVTAACVVLVTLLIKKKNKKQKQ